MMSQDVSIKVVVADREYPLKVHSEEVELVKAAEKEIQSKMVALKANYQVKEKQDLLAMCLLQLLVEKNKASSASQESVVDVDLYSKIVDLESFVSDYLKK